MSKPEFSGKAVIITGASRGIGAATAELFAQKGAFLILGYQNESNGQKATARRLGKISKNILWVRGDVGEESTAKKLCQSAVDQWGKIDIVVANAGIYHFAPFSNIKPKDMEKIIAVNQLGVFYLLKEAGRVMKKAKAGTVVAVSSAVARDVPKMNAVYAGTKAFVEAIVKGFAAEFESYGIRANVVAPGLTETDMTRVLVDVSRENSPEAGFIKDIAQPVDVAQAIVNLCSRESAHLTGQVVSVDRGVLNRDEDIIKAKLKEAKAFINTENYFAAYALLSANLRAEYDYPLQHRIARLMNALPVERIELKPIRIALVSSSTIEHFSEIFKAWLIKDGFAPEVFLAEFDTIDQTIINPNSELYSFNPDIVWIFSGYRDFKENVPSDADAGIVEAAVNNQIQRYINLWQAVQKNCSAYIIQNNADLPMERSLGNLEGNALWGRSNILRRFNLECAKAVGAGVIIFDLDYLSSVYGKRKWFDERYWYHSKHAFDLNASGAVAHQGARLVSAIKGKGKKCIVVDLDNTLWGGVIGDDGIEGITLGGTEAAGESFVDFQRYLKSLKERGIILAVCSKNEPEAAQEPFNKHPDMQLKLDDFAVFIANWENKADNIESIAETLDIGLDSIVFIDDNPAEREFVKMKLPIVEVPDMPEDPSGFIRALDQERFFEAVAISEEDKKRAEMYRKNAKRKEHQNKFTDLSDYLKSLEMKAVVNDFDDMHLPRIAQLINKSNQFHLTTTRYTEAQIRDMMKDSDLTCRYYKLSDKFGDNGLISTVILKKKDSDLFVDTWLMSCRVLSRGMEDFVQNEVVKIAKNLKCDRIVGTYIPTKKNKLVKEHYKKLGYDQLDDQNGTTTWEFKVNGNQSLKETFIERIKEE